MATRNLLIDLAVMAVIGLVLALLGPFGMFGVPFPVRLLYWLTMVLAGYFLFLPAMRAASRTAARLDLPEASMWAAACALACVPMTGAVLMANTMFGDRAWPGVEQAAGMYGNVLVVSAIACTILFFASARRRNAVPVVAAAIAEPAALANPRLFDRLPGHLGNDLVALEMEDHYVRAHTASGSTLILLRMRDAVAELDGIEGMQVHRSWWVARNAVTGTTRDGRNMRLKLRNGIEAPVARAQVEELRAAGWLARR